MICIFKESTKLLHTELSSKIRDMPHTIVLLWKQREKEKDLQEKNRQTGQMCEAFVQTHRMASKVQFSFNQSFPLSFDSLSNALPQSLFC